MGIYHWGGEDCVVKNATVYSDGYETICVRWMDIFPSIEYLDIHQAIGIYMPNAHRNIISIDHLVFHHLKVVINELCSW